MQRIGSIYIAPGPSVSEREQDRRIKRIIANLIDAGQTEMAERFATAEGYNIKDFT